MTGWPTPKNMVPAGGGPAPPARAGGYLSIARRGTASAPPSPGGLARRRWLITAAKFLLPVAATVLLASIALWPELERATDKARVVMTGIGAAVDGARVRGAHYRGVDERNRPYTVTAATASQRDDDRVDLTAPNADITLENGAWLNIRSKLGVYTRRDGVLDLSEDVVLYRDDGTTMKTESATLDTKEGAANSDRPTHVEGPFGTLDAAGFKTVEKGAVVRFWGPARAELNGVTQ